MATQFTTNARIPYPAVGDGSYASLVNGVFTTLDGYTPVGALAVSTTEYPSTTLNIKVSAGSYRSASGAVVAYAGAASTAMTNTATNYVYLTDAGTLTVSTSAFPTTSNIVPLATVVASGGVISSVTDARVAFTSQQRPGPVLPATTVTGASATITVMQPLILGNRAGAIALTLPAASAVQAGSVFVVMDISGAASSNNITTTRAGSDTINGATSTVISTNYGGVRLWCDGVSAWFLLP